MQDVDDNMLDKVKHHLMDSNDDRVHHLIVMNNPKEIMFGFFAENGNESTYFTLITLNVKCFTH
jgi:hypothetical protein